MSFQPPPHDLNGARTFLSARCAKRQDRDKNVRAPFALGPEACLANDHAEHIPARHRPVLAAIH
jgi:hypothetical protein